MAAAADGCCVPLSPGAREPGGLQPPPAGPDHRVEAGVPLEHHGRRPVHHPSVHREPSDAPRPDRRSGRDHQAIGKGARGGALVDLRALPKVELHRHLEGSVRVSTVFELSRRAGIELPADSPKELARHALITSPLDGLEKALEAFAITQNSIRTYEAVRRVTREAIEDLALDNVRVAELRFSPDFLCRPGGLEWDRAFDAMLEGGADALAAGHDLAVGFIVIFSRDYGMESARATVDFAVRHRDELI